jgi:PAP2 superfamily
VGGRREDGTAGPRPRLPLLHHRSLPWLVFGLYMALTTALLIGLGVPLPPDRYFVVLLAPVLFVRRARAFVLDWSPFLLLLFSYEFLRGLAGKVGQVHYLVAIRFDERLFGTAPSVWLQERFAHSAPAPYDYVAAVLYLLHFVAPLTFAFVLWMRSREDFARFTSSFLVLSYAALATFVVFPAAPPWLASQQGYLPQVHEQVGVVLSVFPSHFKLPTVYQLFDPNQVAAIPSLHAAYPLLLLLFACRFFGARALVLAPYVAGVWVAVIYMGEHYVFDVAVGALYSVAAFLLTDHVVPWLRRGQRTPNSAESAAAA